MEQENSPRQLFQINLKTILTPEQRRDLESRLPEEPNRKSKLLGYCLADESILFISTQHPKQTILEAIQEYLPTLSVSNQSRPTSDPWIGPNDTYEAA